MLIIEKDPKQICEVDGLHIRLWLFNLDFAGITFPNTTFGGYQKLFYFH